jgi:hypothetical protein
VQAIFWMVIILLNVIALNILLAIREYFCKKKKNSAVFIWIIMNVIALNILLAICEYFSCSLR